jgi:hypothetical protein
MKKQVKYRYKGVIVMTALKSEEYAGFKIFFSRHRDWVEAKFATDEGVWHSVHAATKEQAFSSIKVVIDSWKKPTTKSVLCNPDTISKDDALYEYRKGDKVLRIYADDTNSSDPREWDNLGIMYCSHKRYSLGDEQFNAESFDGWKEVEEYLVKERKAIAIAPLYLYDHSGLRIKIGSFAGLLPQGHAEFDSGQVGFIYTTKEKLNQTGIPNNNYSITRVLRDEVKLYNHYLSGDVYGFKVFECKNGAYEVTDSAWGYFGTDFVENGLLEATGYKYWRSVK